jgi:hypothetical protein
MDSRVSIVRGQRWARRHTAMVAVVAFGVVVGQAGATQAAAPQTLYVSSTGSNSGTCPETSPCATVSYALTKAASGAIIEVSGTIEDNISISSPVTLTLWPGGGPAGSPGILNGADNGIVVVNNAAGVTIKDLTIEGGGGNNGGGAIENIGTMTLTDSTLTANSSSGGAGIDNSGSMTVTDSTISGNTGGPAVVSQGASTLTIIASTISSNADGGITSNNAQTVAVLAATIVADNKGYNCKAASTTSFKSAGYNLTNDAKGAACSFTSAHDKVNTNPQLGPLAANGGSTKTMLPATSSPAADVIPNPTTLDGFRVCPSADQRRVARPGTGEARCSIGAVEVSSSMATTSEVTASPAKVIAGERVAVLIVVTPKSGTGTPTGSVAFTIGSTTLCKAVLSGGDGACGATNAPVGTDTVTGTYSGADGYAGSSGTTTLTVNKASTAQP